MLNKYGIFSVYGIESEYMIVDKDSLKVMPIADKVLTYLANGKIKNEVKLEKVSWSNELVNHVLEIKCSKPEPSIDNLDKDFHESILVIGKILEKWNARLLPTAMNPWFNPDKDTVLWPHGNREIYDLYNQIFGCKGHGWSNLQSVHINLPYKNEVEFVRLHSAIRFVLPIIPFLSASSPFVEGKKGEFSDNRLTFYEKNQIKIPSIIGKVIPENISSFEEYHKILQKIYEDISPFDPDKILQNSWLNSRGAIAKFDDGAVEIRLMDIQESSYMDFTIIHIIVEMIKFAYEKLESLELKEFFADEYLQRVYEQSKRYTSDVELKSYLDFFEIESTEKGFDAFKNLIIEKFKDRIPVRYHNGLSVLMNKGNLSNRLVKSPLSVDLYKKLAFCLKENIPYEG